MAYESALARLSSLNNKKAEADYSAPALSDYQELEEEKKRGTLRGALYLGEKLAIGFVQANEAITDLVVGGLADVVGADDFAERQFEKGWFENWYSHPDRWYDAGSGMQVAGDISQGIGAMVPAIAATAVATYFTGGGATPLVVGALTTGLSATGSGVTQAVQESGELNSDAYLYGLAQGATETALELATAKVGTGLSKVSKVALKAFGKETAETVVKSGAKYALKELGKEFASEAFEEGMSAMLDPVWQKLTYNPDADINPLNNAKEIGYSALVGGLTGVIMGGGTMTYNSALDLRQGNKILDAGREDGVVATSREILEKQPIGDNDEFYATIKNDIETYEQNVADGKENSFAQKKLLARMQRNNTYAIFDPVIKNSALKVLHNADAVAERYNALGLKDANGNPLTITAEQIRANVDISDPKSIVKALKTNDILRTIAVMDTVGQLTMKVGAFAENVDTPTQRVTQDDINNFVKNADEKTFAEVSRKLGIPPEMWRVMTAEEFNAHLAQYYATEEGGREIARAKLVRQAKAIPEAEAKGKLPTTPRSQKNGTIKRYKLGDVDIAIIKEGSKYTIYDYNTNHATRELALAEAQEKLKSLRENTETEATKVDQKVKEDANVSTKSKFETQIDNWDGKTEGFSFVLGKTSEAISNIKIDGKPIGERQVRLDATKVKTILEQHENMTKEVIKKLPEVINNPVIIVDSKSVKGRLVLFGEVYDAAGRIVLVALELNPATRSGKSTYVDVIKIASAYGKRNIQNLLNESTIRYIDKNKSRVDNWLKVNRLQLPLPNSQLDSATNSISNPDEKINPSDEKSSKNILAKEYREAETFARDNIDNYDKLTDPVKRAIEHTIVEARANGLSDADIVTFAKFSANSGINVSFDKRALITEIDKNGNFKFADGKFKGNTIYVNKDSKRKYSAVIFHELMHSLYKNTGTKAEARLTKKLMKEAYKKMPKERRQKIEAGYKAYYESINQKLTNDILLDEITAFYTEDMLTDVDVLSFLEGEVPGLTKRITSFFSKSAQRHSGDEHLSRAARKYARQFRELYNSITERNKGMNASTGAVAGSRAALDIDSLTETGYNEENENGGTYGRKEKAESDIQEKWLDSKRGWRDISFSDVGGRTRRISEIVRGRENREKINSFAEKIYQKPKTETQDIIALHAENEDLELFFVKWKSGFKDSVIEGNLLFVPEATTEEEFVNILDTIKPVERIVDNKKIAHISEERKNKFLRMYPDAYLTRIPIQQFLNMTTEGHVDQRQIYSTSRKISQSIPVDDIKNTAGEYMYLKVDLKTGEVISHEGRHRMTALLNAGNAYADVFVIAEDANNESYSNITVKGQFNSRRYSMSLVKANSQRFSKAIDNMFWHDDGNIRYALDLDNLPDTIESVGATRTQYAPTIKGKVFDATVKFYIDTVDETFGLQRYLEKVGGNKDAAAVVNMARASRSQAQTMIGSEQYNIFGDKVEKMGEGLQNILAPINKLTDNSNAGRAARRERSKAFDDYLLNLLNIDRMTLEQRSLEKLAEYTSELQELEAKATEAVKAYRSAQKELKALKGRRDAESVAERKKLNDKIAKAKLEVAALESRIKPLKETIDNFEVMKNKPVFDANEKRANAVTAEESQAIVDRYEKKYPQFKEVAEKLYKYLDNLQQMRVEAGLITQEAVDRMKELYPHYVPAYRDTKGGVSVVKGKNNVEVSSTVKSAKGGGQNILNVQNSIAEQTEELMRAGNINRIATAIYEAALASKDTEFVEIKSREKVTKIAEDAEPTVIERPKHNQITFYYKGEKITMSVSRELFIGFEGLYNPSVDPDGFILQGLQKLNAGFKALITQYSPAFAVRNVVRDLQDAGINSKHPVDFYNEYRKAWKAMLSNSKEWQLYRAMGGFSSTVFTLEGLETTVGKRGFTDLRSLFDNINDSNDAKRVLKTLPRFFNATLEGIGTLNAMLEQVTRFAEFKNSLAHGADLQTALFDSAEVTTNFGRKGRLTKTLNATIMPFLNPAIQGFDKMIRNFKDVTKYRGKDLVRAIIQLISKLAILGIAPIIANMWMYDGDDDYEKLRDADKENNFLVKIGDGQFIKIPRGRVAGVIGSFYRRSVLTAQGEDADWKGFVDNAISNVTPVENMSRTIFSPFVDVNTNTTWYGSAIEGREFEDTAPRDRYDESTSDIAIALAKIVPEFLNYSPKKIHYLLDQYSGVIGDFALPATTAKNKGTVVDQIKSYGKNFVIDAETSNKISAKFYELYDETQYAKTAGDEAAIYRLKYLNKVKSSTSALYKEKKAIQADTSLSATDRLQQARVVQGLINEAQKNAMTDIKLLDKAIEATKGISDEDERFTEITHLVFGAQTALEWYNKSVYEKATLVNSAGIDYDDYYYYYFTVKDLESDKDKQGNTIEGSKRKKVISAISEMGLSTEQTLLLIATSGYALKDNDIRGMTAARANRLLLQYIMKQKLTKEQKEELAKQCGFTVKNGKIILKS